MTNEDTKQLIHKVEEATGYKVSIERESIPGANARMLSAAPGRPSHIIYVAEDKVAAADYIVATQCVMLLTMWSHPKGVAQFATLNDKVDYAIRKLENWKGFSGVDRESVEKVARMLMTGLIQQLNSTPGEMLAIEHCYRHCPTLRAQQEQVLAADFRKYTASFRPDNKKLLPPEIFEKNQSMCAALALLWAELSGKRSILVPYDSVGLTKKGADLLADYRATTGTDGERMTATVDAWADKLYLRTLFQWNFRKH